MIPTIFISSTIEDLNHLRDSVRQTAIDLGYNPIMSDYGDIGYITNTNVEDACYNSMRESKLAVFIIGKRYGSIGPNDISITNNEFKVAKSSGVPCITLVEKEVLTFKKVYDKNVELEQKFPSMDNPQYTFNFINEIMQSEVNNGILGFETTTEAQRLLKKQFANLFGELLYQKYDPMQKTLLDIYSEIKTLNHEMLKPSREESKKFLKATRFLLTKESDNKNLSSLVEHLEGSIELAIPKMIASSNFKEYLKTAEIKFELVEDYKALIDEWKSAHKFKTYTMGSMPLDRKKGDDFYFWGINVNNKLFLNQNGLIRLTDIFETFKDTVNTK